MIREEGEVCHRGRKMTPVSVDLLHNVKKLNGSSSLVPFLHVIPSCSHVNHSPIDDRKLFKYFFTFSATSTTNP